MIETRTRPACRARRARRVLAAPVLTGVAVCGVGAPQSAHADAENPDWLTPVVAESGADLEVVDGLTVRPERPARVLPVEGYRLTAHFGYAGGYWSSDHTGLDFAAPEGTPLRAIGDGVVTGVAYDGAYGSKTVIRLEDGTELWYCHQASQSVAVGERVSAGQVIGAVGSTGNTTGPHLHLEVRPGGGDPVDPEAALSGWGLRA